MHSQDYIKYENAYKELIQEMSLCVPYVSSSNVDENFTAFYIEILQLNLLTKMALLEPSSFEYSKDINAIFNDILNWINNRINFNPYSNAKIPKAKNRYDRYLLITMLLDDDCESYWRKEIKREFKFFFKKMYWSMWIARWSSNVTAYAEKKGYYYFSYLFAKNALTTFSIHNKLDNTIRNGFIDYYNRGKERFN